MHIATAEPTIACEAPPELAQAILAEAMEERTPLRSPRPTFAERVAAFDAAQVTFLPLSEACTTARTRFQAVLDGHQAEVDAAEATIPAPSGLTFENTGVLIAGGYIDWSDGTRQDFKSEPTFTVRGIADLHKIKDEAKRIVAARVLDKWMAQRKAAGRSTVPAVAEAEEAWNAASKARWRAATVRERAYNRVMAFKPKRSAELLEQLRVFAAFHSGELAVDGAVTLGGHVWIDDVTNMLGRVTGALIREAGLSRQPA